MDTNNDVTPAKGKLTNVVQTNCKRNCQSFERIGI